MADVLKFQKGLTEEQHQKDHDLIEEVRPLLVEFLEDRKRARELREKFKQSLVGAVAVTLVSGIAAFLVWAGGIAMELAKQGRHP